MKNKKKLDFYIPQYAGYIQHGIPVRFFVNKGIKTIGAITSNQYSKKFTKKDVLHVYNCKNVKKDFSKLTNQAEKRKIAKKTLLEKFSGKITDEYSYMRNSYFKKKNKKINKQIDVIIFLSNFVDAPHCYGNFVFNDFQEWLEETMRYLNNIKGLKIAIKEHPNSLYVSQKLIFKYKKMYKNAIWINSKTSNKSIFSKKISCGLSPYGTVLHELACYKITPIATGDNPYMSFDFVKTPNNKKQYFSFINNSLKRKKFFRKNLIKELEESYYMYFLHDNDYIKNYSRIINLKKFHQGSGVNDIGLLKNIIQRGLIK